MVVLRISSYDILMLHVDTFSYFNLDRLIGMKVLYG